MYQTNIIMTTPKTIKTTMTKLKAVMSKSPSFLCRVVLFIAVFLMSQGYASAQTVTTTITRYVVANDGANNGNPYTATFYSTGTDNEIWNSIKAAFPEAEPLTDANCFARWDVKKGDGTYANPEAYNLSQGRVRFFFNGVGGNEYLTRDFISGEKQYIYTSDNFLSETYGLNTKLNATVNFGTNVFQLGSTLECYITNNGPSANSDPTDGYIVKVEIRFTEDGLAPDDFYGTYSGSEPTPVNLEIPKNTISKEVTFNIATGNAKYARFVLFKDGEEQSISRTAITVTGGQSSAERPKRGVYVYNNGGLGSSINVTVSLDAGTFEDYQLVAYFSDEAPTLDGDNITKEPALLDEKQIYSFIYPVTPIDKYIAWNTNTTTINLASYLATDLPDLTNNSTTGYIGWSVYDGPYGTGSHVNIQGNHYNASVAPAWAMNFKQNPTQQVWSVSDGQISSNWNDYTNVPVYAPGTQKFEDYKNHIVVAEVSDVSSEKIRVRYIFHFTDDGQPPYRLINETDIAADKKVVSYTDYKADNKVFNVSDALVSEAKYARIYLEKYGNANAQSGNLTITYDGATITQCATGKEKYGWYLSVAGGIDPSKLSVTGLDADEMMKYNLVIVSSTNALSGAGEQEPAWEKKTVYSLQREIKNRINASDEETGTGAINIQSDILSRLDATVANFSKSLYAKWYVESPSGDKQPITGGSGANDADNWTFSILNSNSGNWVNEGNTFKFYTDQSENTYSSSSMIENGSYGGDAAWTNQIAKADGIYVLSGKYTSDFIGYKIVFEFSDDYDTSTNGTDPGYRLKYIYTITDPSAFTGDPNTGAATESTTQTVSDRDATSVTVDLTTTAFAHSKLTGSSKAKYARFYLTDTDGNLVEPDGKLVVSYSGGTVTACTKTEQGFYIYDGPDGGGDITELTLENITVQLTTPKAYKLYKVVGVFSTEMAEVVPEGGATPLSREPDWDLKYTYSFTYPAPTTNEISKTMEWRRRGMTADASTTDPETDWGTSWEELSVGQCVKWYVVDKNNNVQALAIGDSRQANTWTIDLPSPFAVDGNKTVTTGQTAVNATKWNGTWGKPTIYAPTGKNYDGPEGVKDYKIICEIAAEADASATPHAKYTFSLVKSFFGELKDEGTEDSETATIERTSTSETVALGTALTKWGGTNAKYARVWLTDASGTMVDPTGLLSVTGMSTFDGHPEYGFYVSAAGGISLSDATLMLAAGQYANYQVHVALSTDPAPAAMDHEPDYNFLYTFKYDYPVKKKYKTVIYDPDTGTTRFHLFANWFEIVSDCRSTRDDLASHGYARWYLEAVDGTRIPIENFAANESYTEGANGYYKYQFNKDKFPISSRSINSDFDPIITLPEAYRSGDAWKNVRVVCVVTTKDDDINLPDNEPTELQIKYVYTLRTADELKDQPFVHYRGEGFMYLTEQGLDERAASYDYTTLSGNAGITEYDWNSTENDKEVATGNIRQTVHTVDYYYYYNIDEGGSGDIDLPFMDFDGNLPTDVYAYGPGSDTEPMGFIRWYDWKSDKKYSGLVKVGGDNNKLLEKDWGLIATIVNTKPKRTDIGVTFTAPAGFANLTAGEEIVIACDVSRYMDGMDESFTYLVHEPTLSMRYLFHILPAKVIADDMRKDTKANNLAAVENQIKTLEGDETPTILEYEGRTVISTNNGVGEFSMRTKLGKLGRYYVYDGSNNICAADYLQWYAYYQDGEGVWWKYKVNMGDRKNDRQAIYQLTDLNNGTWSRLDGEFGALSKTIGVGDKVLMIACVGNISIGESYEVPIVWTELEFIDAAPLPFGDESKEVNKERSERYLSDSYTHAKTLDFNEYFLRGRITPTNSFDNYTKIPLEQPMAQYGFCYPQLYGLCATNWFITTDGGWAGYGVAPLHGDYTLLKSMNMPGVSETVNSQGKNEAQVSDGQSLYTRWYDTNVLYDVTHERISGKSGDDTADYGGFLYVDAADEARTIAVLDFDAALCANSKIYYTAYIADMTDAVTRPQVHFRVFTYNTVDGNHDGTLMDGETAVKEVPVVSFVTGNIRSEGATETGKWYQVYGYTTLPTELKNYLTGSSRHFYVDINNYCENTSGADYCVDQISFYTSTAKVKVKQVSSPCDEGAGVEVKIIADAESLIGALGKGTTTNLFYRIFEKHDDMSAELLESEALIGDGLYTGDPLNDNRYAKVVFNASYNEAELPVGELPAGETTGYYKGNDGVVYFQFDDRYFPLEINKTYFVSFFEIGENAAGAQHITDWGNPYRDNICSTYSNYITPDLLRIDLESGGEVSDGNIRLTCGSSMIEKTFDITVQYPTDDGLVPYENVKFDFYEGSKAEFKSITNEAGDLYLEKALDHFRMNYPNYKTADGDLPTDYITTEGFEYTEAMHDLIQQHVIAGKMKLLATTKFNYEFSEAGEMKFAAIPVTRHVDEDRSICSPLEFVFNVNPNSDAPKMELGFDDVNYPVEYTKRVVRVGLEQLKKMKEDGYKLHIPVSNYQNKGTGIGNKLHFSNLELTLSDTNDPTIDLTSSQPKFAKVFDPAGGNDVYVNTNRMYLPLDFTNCEVTFHEGYYYEVSTSFYDEEESGYAASDRCIGDLYLVFKVVPEFVTWNARKISTDAEVYSGNWDDDSNWNRSTRAELYKDVNNNDAMQNTATAGHPTGYQDNIEIDATLTERPGFVPMKFTYVTMLGMNHSPSLFNESSGGKEPGTIQTGGDLISYINEMGTDTSPSGGSSYPTENIKYDMLVRYGTHAQGGEGCFGHRYKKGDGSGGYGWANDPRAAADIEALTNVYDVEKFYGNICKEIYFKPGAELRLQQRLTYEKAWVEKELVANKWYLMSAPLKGTFAGDMYVPATAMTDYSLDTPAEVKGRQVTEAFQPINFDKSKGYSRTLYPIYQRSWGQTAKVYTKTDDIRATDYSAKLKFGSVSSNLVEWGHTYNDVQVPYTGYSGFAIRANKKDQTDNTLIRLPKADTQYDYYQWNNETASTGGVTQTVTKGSTVYGRLVYDNQGGGLMSDDLEQWSIPLANLQVQGTDEDGYTYYLVGNPFMASIDMGKFFGYLDGGSYYSYNPKLNPVYYTYEAGTVTAVDARTTAAVIRPLQAFIVKCKANDAPEGIVFNRWAITDGNYTPPTLYVPEGGSGTRAMNPTLTLRAANGNGSSKATVRIDASASSGYNAKEDASTLFDSNLSDVPMVYTVAGSRAVSIDSRPDLDVVSFGVACASNDELVEVNVDCSKFTDNGLQFTDDNHLYIIDAVTGSIMEVGVGSSFAVQPNDYGRYFLTTNGDMTAIRETLASENIVVSVRNRQLTVRSASELKMVRVLDTNGIVVASLNDCGTETTVNLALSGVYIIEAETEHGRKTRKVIVK